MAYEDYGYDPMGNVTGYVDQAAEAIAQREEEERKRKEEELARKENERLAKERDNLAVHKQEVTTYANGSKTITNVAEVPATANAPGRPNISPVAPQGQQRQQSRAPVVAVAPDDIFQNQLRAESGNRQNDRQGQIMTSPKGALGIAQIMPATAMQPGYGVPDIFTLAQQRGIEVPDRSEATAKQLLANQALNQEFGQNYSTAMRNRFGESAGVAAYNAGPGAVERNMGRNQGQFNVAQAPQETQGYLDKVMRGVGNVVEAVIPSAQAGTLQQPPANVGSSGFEAYDRNRPGNAAYEGGQPTYDRNRPGNAAFEGVAPVAPDDSVINNQVADYERRQATGNMDPGRGAVDYSLGARQPVASSAGAIDAYQKVQDNPMELMKLGVSDDPNVPTYIKERARNRAADLVQQERIMANAQEQASRMTPTESAKVLRKKTEEGSAVKLWMYKMLRMDGHAAEESDKLGFGREVAVMGADNKAYLIKIGESGKPLSGYSADTQKDLTQDELIKVAAGATAQKGTEVEAGTYMDPTGKISGNWVLERKPGGSQYRQVGTGKIATEEQANSLRKTSVAGTLSDQLASQRQKLQEQTRFLAPKAALEFYGKFDAENGTRFAEDYKTQNPQYFTPEGTLKPGVAQGGAIPPTPLPAGTAGATQAPAGGSVAPGQLPAAPAVAQKPVVTQSPADIVSEREAGRTKAKEEAEITGKDIGTIRANQGKAEANADYLVTKINELVAHPGFETSVGRKGLSYGFGLTKEPILEGTDASDWQARFKEVGGQSFLQAIENLRGMGALSNLEGETATKAIQRMSTSQSEKEFKTAAQDFNNIITRGIDRNRVKLGQAPKFGTKPESEIASGGGGAATAVPKNNAPLGSAQNPIKLK